ncbi:MAG: hypothetical protein GEV06_18410 [Luteitalea sp.]|nr:hypothetical protein [Luteitalea sp.]
MRCPKCQYISFDTEERCRNCGYDLSLVAPSAEPEPDLTISRSEPDETSSPADLDLAPEAPSADDSSVPPSVPELPDNAEPLDLPLFGEEGARRAPAGLPPSARAPRSPRRPVVVRGSDAPRSPQDRERPEPTLLSDREEEHEPWEGGLTIGRQRESYSAGRFEPESHDIGDVEQRVDERHELPAPLDRRVVAGLVDAFVLLIIDLTVLYLTRRVTGVSWSELRLLPLAPLIGFLALLDAGYLVTFTAASGQTIGKSIMRLRVVGETSSRVPLGNAIVRAVVYLVSVVPLGLGLLPMLFGSDRRAWHDRITGTRVVVTE